MNKAIVLGRLTRDPEIMYSNNGANSLVIAKYSIAVKRDGKSDDANFFEVTAFGKNAEFAEKYLRKGMKIILEGHLQSSSYTNKEGNKSYKVEIIAENVDFAESKSDSEARMTAQVLAAAPVPQQVIAPQQAVPQLSAEQMMALTAMLQQQAAPVPQQVVAPQQAAPVPQQVVAPQQVAPAPQQVAPVSAYPNDLGFH